MLSKNKIKFIQSLSRKKKRDQEGLFLAEGDKLIGELLDSGMRFHSIVTTRPENFARLGTAFELIEADADALRKISLLKTPSSAVALVYQEASRLSDINLNSSLVLALDEIQDPGNLGTIIRLASWFGIRHLVCDNNTADCYNPKVIQSTMGAIAHVDVHYTQLADFLLQAKQKGIPLYGTFLDGENIYETPLSNNGVVIMGNEGKGIAADLEKLIDRRLFIPSFADAGRVESLNVSMAASIICSEFRRRTI